MKSFFSKIHNLVFIFFVLATIWSIYSFFSWHIKSPVDKLPETIEKYISENIDHGEPFFLSCELLDGLVLNYPELNIFPGGGNSLKNASSYNRFYIISGYQTLECSEISKDYSSSVLVKQNDMKLISCKKEKSGYKEFFASSFIEKFKVTTGEENIPAPFSKGRFLTGDKGWQRINVEPAFFDGEQKIAINAHPLSDNREITVILPALKKDVHSLVAGFGIADSGKTKRSTPVVITFHQDEAANEFKSVDGRWIEKELENISPDKPVKVTIRTKKAARRHFYFDIKYIVKD